MQSRPQRAQLHLQQKAFARSAGELQSLPSQSTQPVGVSAPFRCSRPAFAPAMMSAVMSERGACFAASTSAPRLQRNHQAARPILCCASHEAGQPIASDTTSDNPLSRRAVMSASLASAAVTLLADTPAYAVQGYTAGRIPGLTKTPDAEGFYTYTRPEGKQGGHGVGWSELPRYAFKIPSGWSETAVSIADLGGTEIDLRYTNPEEGGLEVVVAPVMRFKDIEFNANVKIEEIAPPERIISGFALEIFGAPLQEEDVLQQEVESKDGLTYYSWELKPHRLVTATAVKNRLILLSITANARQWRKSQDHLKHMWKSLSIVTKTRCALIRQTSVQLHATRCKDHSRRLYTHFAIAWPPDLELMMLIVDARDKAEVDRTLLNVLYR